MLSLILNFKNVGYDLITLIVTENFLLCMLFVKQAYTLACLSNVDLLVICNNVITKIKICLSNIALYGQQLFCMDE